jgi:hypothetical protein
MKLSTSSIVVLKINLTVRTIIRYSDYNPFAILCLPPFLRNSSIGNHFKLITHLIVLFVFDFSYVFSNLQFNVLLP